MIADLIITACSVGILLCLIYIIFQVNKLRKERKCERDDDLYAQEIFAEIEDDAYDD